MTIIKTEITTYSKNLVIELAKSLDIDFPKDKTCKDCFHYDYGEDRSSVKPNQHSCWNENKVVIHPCDPDDISHIDYTDPYNINNLEEAISCPYYKSGLEEYKRLCNQLKQELDELKNNIIILCQ